MTTELNEVWGEFNTDAHFVTEFAHTDCRDGLPFKLYLKPLI